MNNLKISKDNLVSVLYYIAYIMFIVISMTRWVYNIDGIQYILNLVYRGILVYIFIFNLPRINYKEIFKLLLIVGVGFLTSYFSKNPSIFNISLFVINSKNINFKNLIKVDFITKIITFTIVLLLYKAGLTENIIYYTIDRGIRYSFGFGHPNTFGVYILSMSADFIYLYRKKNKFIVYLILLLLVFILNIYCDSRSSMLGIILLVVFSILLDNNKIKIKKYFTYLYPVLALVSVVIAIIFKNGSPNAFFIKLDNLFSYRLSLMGAFFNRYPVTLFGNYFVDYNTRNRIDWTYVLDNAYLTMLLRFGIISFLYCLVMIPILIKSAINRNDYKLVICLSVFCLFGLMENGLFVLFYNPFILAIAIDIFKKGDINEN